MSSIATVPPEILSNIFVLAQPRRCLRHTLPLEVLLSHVSSRWRSVALSTPTLWTTVEIYSTRSLEPASLYVARSGMSLPLNFRLEIYEWEGHIQNSDDRLKAAFLQSVLSLLQACIHRCHSLLLFSFNESTVDNILSGLQDYGSPTLQRICIHMDAPERTLSNLETAQPLLKAGTQSLKFLEIETVTYLPAVSNLVTLHLHNIAAHWFTYDESMKLFAQTSSLENLLLSGRSVIPFWPYHGDAPTFTMKKLHSLQISEELPGLATKFLLSVRAPSLESIWLSCSFDNFARFFEAQQMNARTSKFPQLKYLTLESYNMHETRRIALAFPTITHLHLPYAKLYHFRHFSDALSIEPPIWPNLDTIIVTATREVHVSRLKEGLCGILPRRGEMSVPIRLLLTDRDILACLAKQKSDLLEEYLVMEELGTGNYQEPWWIMSHEETMDRIGLR